VRTTEDMLLLVPNTLREASSALGLPRWIVIRDVAYRAARAGMITGVLLAVARITGETAPLLLVGALTFVSVDPTLLGSFTALPIQIYQWVGSSQEEFLALAAAGLGAGVALWPHADVIAQGLGQRPLRAILMIKLLFFATLLLHQLGHALALVHYGRRVREFGFTFLHGFIPSFYVDVTDIFMVNRRARVVTALAGALVHLALGSLWFLAALGSPPGFVQAFAAASGMIQWQAFVIALYPCCFIEMDGYHVMVDLLGQPTLRSDAVAYAGSLVRGAPSLPWGRQAQLLVAYIVISTISLAALVAFNVWMVVNAVS